MAKDAYYFSHDANARNDEKIIELMMDYDWKGYGLYWALVEMLRETDAYELQTDCKRIAYALRTDEKTINDIINKYGLFEIDGKFFYSKSLKRRMLIKEEKSNKARKSANIRWGNKNDTNAMQTHSESNAIKGKENKENKENINNPEFIDKYEEWILRPQPSTLKKYELICRKFRIYKKEDFGRLIREFISDKKIEGTIFNNLDHVINSYKLWLEKNWIKPESYEESVKRKQENASRLG